ncbi:hypothetical protein B0H14DRAFT_2610923 [Mycena olivaceomarginata]|nr:hypothetical protein B0H14DRAFT_2610923 [Mycena olivaceomarginata]
MKEEEEKDDRDGEDDGGPGRGRTARWEKKDDISENEERGQEAKRARGDGERVNGEAGTGGDGGDTTRGTAPGAGMGEHEQNGWEKEGGCERKEGGREDVGEGGICIGKPKKAPRTTLVPLVSSATARFTTPASTGGHGEMIKRAEDRKAESRARLEGGVREEQERGGRDAVRRGEHVSGGGAPAARVPLPPLPPPRVSTPPHSSPSPRRRTTSVLRLTHPSHRPSPTPPAHSSFSHPEKEPQEEKE